MKVQKQQMVSNYVSSFDKKYFVSFQDRNDKNAQHLLITNYKIGD